MNYVPTLAVRLSLATVLILALAAPTISASPEKVTICHKPGEEAEQTMEVPPQAVPGHLGHGDRLGECEGSPPVDPPVDPPVEPPKDGKDGRDGKDGKDGRDGRDAAGNLLQPFLVIEQDYEQEAESGDVSQSFNVTQTGSNSNQCAGVQGVANTGNAQNIGNGDASINVSPSNTTNCSQEVNQVAVVY